MAKSRQKTSDHETPEQRVAYLMEFSKGTLPIAIIAYSEQEAVELRKIVERKGKKAANLSVLLESEVKRKPVTEVNET